MSETATQYALGITNKPIPTLTNSSISTFMECPRKYELMYKKMLRTDREADYFRIGGAYHLAHEVMGKTGNVKAAIEAIYDNYNTPPEYIQESEELLDKWYYEATTCVCLFNGYIEHYGNQHEIVVETERVFTVPIKSPETGVATPRWRREGKIDKIIQLPDGRFAVLEYKTSGEDISPGSDYWWRLKIEPQPSGYYIASKYQGYRIDTVVYDVTRKPPIRPSMVPLTDDEGYKIVVDQDGNRVRNVSGKKDDDGQYSWRQSADTAKGYVLQTRKMTLAEWEHKLMTDIRHRPEFYYVRDEITRLDSDLHDYEVDLWAQQKTIADAESKGRFYKNTRACHSRTRCPFFNLCTGKVEVQVGEVPEGFRLATSAHEELEA